MRWRSADRVRFLFLKRARGVLERREDVLSRDREFLTHPSDIPTRAKVRQNGRDGDPGPLDHGLAPDVTTVSHQPRKKLVGRQAPHAVLHEVPLRFPSAAVAVVDPPSISGYRVRPVSAEFVFLPRE